MTEGHHRKVPINIGTAGLSVLRVHGFLPRDDCRSFCGDSDCFALAWRHFCPLITLIYTNCCPLPRPLLVKESIPGLTPRPMCLPPLWGFLFDVRCSSFFSVNRQPTSAKASAAMAVNYLLPGVLPQRRPDRTLSGQRHLLRLPGQQPESPAPSG